MQKYAFPVKYEKHDYTIIQFHISQKSPFFHFPGRQNFLSGWKHEIGE